MKHPSGLVINTKFKEGDTIFFLHQSRVISSECQGIKIERLFDSAESCFATSVMYLLNKEKGSNVNMKVYEPFAFASKEELLKSL